MLEIMTKPVLASPSCLTSTLRLIMELINATHTHTPDLLVGFTADFQHLFALELQLLGQSADVLVQRVDLMIQMDDVVLPASHFLLELRDATQQLPFLRQTHTHTPLNLRTTVVFLAIHVATRFI